MDGHITVCLSCDYYRVYHTGSHKIVILLGISYANYKSSQIWLSYNLPLSYSYKNPACFMFYCLLYDLHNMNHSYSHKIVIVLYDACSMCLICGHNIECIFYDLHNMSIIGSHKVVALFDDHCNEFLIDHHEMKMTGNFDYRWITSNFIHCPGFFFQIYWYVK